MKARKLPSGNYNVQYYYTDIEGNKKRGSITRSTKAEAEYEGNRIKMENSSPPICTSEMAQQSHFFMFAFTTRSLLVENMFEIFKKPPTKR